MFSILSPLFKDNSNVRGTYNFPQEVTSTCKPGSYGTKKTFTAIPMKLIGKMDSNSILENLKEGRVETISQKANISVTK